MDSISRKRFFIGRFLLVAIQLFLYSNIAKAQCPSHVVGTNSLQGGELSGLAIVSRVLSNESMLRTTLPINGVIASSETDLDSLSGKAATAVATQSASVYWSVFTIGMNSPETEEKIFRKTMYGLSALNAINLSESFSLGINIAVSAFGQGNGLIESTLDIRLSAPHRRVRFGLFFDFGYAWYIASGFGPYGLEYFPGISLSCRVSQRTSIYFSASHKWLQSRDMARIPVEMNSLNAGVQLCW